MSHLHCFANSFNTTSDLYRSDNYCLPTYPKTSIVRNSLNDYSLVYSHSVPISSFTPETAPETLFNYASTYYINLQQIISDYRSKIDSIRYQLEAFNSDLMDEFINEHIDELYNNYYDSIQTNIEVLSNLTPESVISSISSDNLTVEDIKKSEIKSLSSDIESELSEQQTALDNIFDSAYADLQDKWFLIHNTTSDSEQSLKDLLSQYILKLSEVESYIISWKQNALNTSSEAELKVVNEFRSIPHDFNDFKFQLRKHYLTEISNHTTNIKNSVLDIVKSKVPNLPQKYHSDLLSKTLLNRTNKTHKIIDDYMNAIRDYIVKQLNRIINCKFDFNITDWYQLKQRLFPIVSKSISDLATSFYNSINESLSYIHKYNIEISNLETLKRTCTQINSDMMSYMGELEHSYQNIDYDSFPKLDSEIEMIISEKSLKKRCNWLITILLLISNVISLTLLWMLIRDPSKAIVCNHVYVIYINRVCNILNGYKELCKYYYKCVRDYYISNDIEFHTDIRLKSYWNNYSIVTMIYLPLMKPNLY